MGQVSRSAGQAMATLVGRSAAMAAIRQTIAQVADSASSVLITGPSGTGKDVVAQLLHQCSRRAARPFIALNCAAVASELLESELFGHEVGAFTGAVKARTGRFEAAHRGSLFLDEVGDMPGAMQAKLLRALETRVVERVGGMLPIAVDVRLIAATSVNLEAAIDRGQFRADLLYRLDVIRIEMPSLAARAEDIPLLIQHFAGLLPGEPVRFTAAAMDRLCHWPWPGNVRELRNFVDRAQVLFPGEVVTADALDRLLRPVAAPPLPRPPRPAATPGGLLTGDGVDLKQVLADMEQAYIREALSLSGGTIAATARLLGLQRTTLIEKMRRFQMDTASA